jgi:hypothetical protein
MVHLMNDQQVHYGTEENSVKFNTMIEGISVLQNIKMQNPPTDSH